MALAEISKDKEEATDDEEAKTPSSKGNKKAILGTTSMIKLPYVIGTPEFAKHPYAGIIYLGNLGEDLEQTELH